MPKTPNNRSVPSCNKTPTFSRVLFSYMAEHRWSTAFFILFGLFWAFTLPYMSYLLGQIIDEIKFQNPEHVDIFSLVLTSLILYVSIHVLRSLGYYVHGLFSLVSIPEKKANLIKQLFNHLGNQSIGYFEDKHSGYLTNKITNASSSIEPLIFNLFTIIYPQSLAIILTGILLSLVVPYFGMVLWIWGATLIIYSYHSAKIGNDKAMLLANSNSKVNGKVVDVVNNIHTVIYNAEMSFELDSLDKDIQDMVQNDRNLQRHMSKVMLVQHIAMNILVAFFLIGSVVGYDYGYVSMGNIVFVMTSVTAIAGLTSSLGKCFLDFVNNAGRLNEGLSLLEDQQLITDNANAQIHQINKGEIQFNDISFAYPNQKPIFLNFNLTIPAKQKIGIVGSSGAGKTTLFKLLMRLYNVEKGVISIDSLSINAYTKKSLCSQIAIVPQHLTLFHRSIYDNITYGCSNLDKSDVILAAKKAHCHEFISELPQQYDTIIGEQGVKLSGGQRQRIAFARAILKNAPVLLLDEATSALDSRTEQAIQDGLQNLLTDKTALVIAHRLSTLKAMDRIIVLEDGKIIENGTHTELLEKKGAYYNYWTHQSEGFIRA
ncbi:ABC transporter ATP-binding protein [Legionella pneumophila]|uniref:Multidrug resistance ABC transporter ATP-binding protein n=1 Tax=Legionella pneumophila subsp. pascullei TaxID=91890 RepID=A0AAX2J0E2_LEGPN|nr:ABC transporter ATP-binding protein [Legionella pneumophila]AMP94012.1 multidrug ABC transporter ATP-binding protein [Legionella pneumophila subsp. pascullei]AMP96923.1 multidrug ABC transporter ATP-binding protein [Legionella pneumophila subsp. pascullei]SQG90948.1 multidrug resistance ABC transporter ATP-binding protein [Legionella pneumophila subsp. pascullei]VEH07493.1 multidrug resistance ABC transporter ATP-binding protein [Legionella pneumophila subsp. pascullei]HDU8260571.1 ABC tran